MMHRALMQVLDLAEGCASCFILFEPKSLMLRDKFDKYLRAILRTEFANILRRRSALFEVSKGDMSNLHS